METVFLKLQCRDCDFVECSVFPQKKYLYNKEGCTRKVSEEVAAQFQHYTQEVIPFWQQYPQSFIQISYKEIINFLYDKIYFAPIGQQINSYGKVKK